MRLKLFLSLLLLALSPPAWARELTVLFIGNSHTYLPEQGTPEDPALPKLVRAIGTSIEPDLQLTYEFSTEPGYSFGRHLENPKSTELLGRHFDRVILQGQSIESLELPEYWDEGRIGEKFFAESLPRVLGLVLAQNTDVTFYVNWGWDPKNEALQEGHPGLYFPKGSKRAGQKWCGQDKYELQRMIDESYERHTGGYPVKLAKVGRAWIRLQNAGVVEQDELYIPGDWSHASVLGAYIAALVLARDALGLDISRNTFVPEGMDRQRAEAILKAL